MSSGIIISARDVEKTYPGTTLFHDVNFDIYEGDRIGLIGANGTGKTTLIRLITGMEKPDLGEIYIRDGLRFGILWQYDESSERTIAEEVARSEFLSAVKREIDEINSLLADPGFYEREDYMDIMNRYAELQEIMAKYDTEGFKANVIEVLKHLKFPNADLSRRVCDLSGGERRKVALARVLVGMKDMDVLILDEPTNHLDIEAIEWLEDYLMEFEGTMIIISHDRFLLDDMVHRIFEIENSRLYVWNGDYTEAMEMKQQYIEALKRARKRQLREIQKEKEIIEKKRRRNKYDAQIRERIKRIQKKRKLIGDPVIKKRAMNIKFREDKIGSRIILRAENLSKAMGGRELFRDLNIEVEAGEKIGVIGPNGSGKSTFFRMIIGSEPVDGGTLWISRNATIGYYDQGHLSLHGDLNLIEELQTVDEKLSIEECKAYLGRFEFRGDTVYRRVGDLSGGERARLALLKLVLGRYNMLILDEPTNHLDIMGREMVERAINSYGGTVLIASHDRYFIDATVDRILALRDGKWITYPGNYSDFRDALHRGIISWD